MFKDARTTLSVRIERKGELLQRAAFPAYGAEMRLPAQPFSEIGGAYKVDRHRGLAAIARVLDDGGDKKLQQHLSGDRLLLAGRVLFEAVFGPDEAGWAPCFKRLFGEAWTSPWRYPVRLRVVTEDPQLQSMPWGLMAFGGDYLRDSGWTFEVGAEVAPRGDIDLSLPTGILLILPELGAASDDTGSGSHHRAIRELVAAYMPDLHPDQLRVARTREEVRIALVETRPTIVYYYGHGEVPDDGQAFLRIPAANRRVGEDPHRWNVHDLARAFCAERAPDLVYLNGCRTGQGTLQSIASRLARVTPVVLAHPTDALSGPASEVATRFFRRLFSAESDPIEVAMRRDASEPTTGLGWLPLLAFGNYRSFSIRFSKLPRAQVVRPVDFDRHRQRQVASATLRDIVQEPARRVQAFVIVGPPENHQHEVAGQLRDYIDRRDVKCDLLLGAPIDVSARMFEPDPSGLDAVECIEGRLKVNLGKEWRSKLTDTILERAPGRVTRRSRVLWLDWGVLAREKVSGDLRDWLTFCAGRLAKACPDDLRIIVTLAFEVPPDRLDKVLAGVSDIVGGLEYRSDKFRACALDVLGPATLGEIVDFLVDHGCDGNLVNALATLMYKATNKGEYAPLRKLIARASASTYEELHRELLRAHGSAPLVDDF
jgi:hypothetical protein